MIVKASDELREIALVVPSSLPEPLVQTDCGVVTIGTADGPRLIPIPGKPLPVRGELLYLKPLVPDWMLEALTAGNVLVLDQKDWSDLDPEIREQLEVLKP